ncbi:MAG: electron transport complex subunit RsxG [Gammaproteobacteria bacterium]
MAETEPSTRIPRRMAVAAGLLALFAVIGAGLVAITEDATRERIKSNQREYLLRSLNDVLPSDRYDNVLFEDTIEVTDTELLGSDRSITVYRGRLGTVPVAAILTPVAPDGYSGPIRLLVGIDYDGTLTGVRVVTHRETPGLGDAIEVERSDWIRRFDGLGLGNPPLPAWTVRRDGGDFDQFTGATVTPRAVVKAVRNALLYFSQHRDELFEAPPAITESESGDDERDRPSGSVEE